MNWLIQYTNKKQSFFPAMPEEDFRDMCAFNSKIVAVWKIKGYLYYDQYGGCSNKKSEQYCEKRHFE